MSEDIGQILNEGFAAMAHIGELTHAVSTAKRFGEWSERTGLNRLESEINAAEARKGYFFEGKEFRLYEQLRRTGYGAWHVGSIIDGLRVKGKEVLIVDSSRNRRFVFARTLDAVVENSAARQKVEGMNALIVQLAEVKKDEA